MQLFDLLQAVVRNITSKSDSIPIPVRQKADPQDISSDSEIMVIHEMIIY